MKRSQKRFTLVELLVVIGIIAVLAGILLPTISIAIKKVRIGRARTEMASLITAIKMYESEYDLLPIKYTSVDSAELDNTATPPQYDELISFLSQTGSYKANGNLRKNKMLDVKRPGEYKDPWGKDYHVVFDTNADGSISSTSVDGMVDAKDLPYSIIVWSDGPDKEFSTTDSNSANKDNVYSIETNWQPNGGHVLR